MAGSLGCGRRPGVARARAGRCLPGAWRALAEGLPGCRPPLARLPPHPLLAGALVGALVGASAIPDRFLAGLARGAELRGLAERLAADAFPDPA